MKSTGIVFLFQFMILLCFGQEVPGYQGKRFSANYDGFIFPALFHPTGEFYETSSLAFNKRHSLGIDYVISRSSSMGMDLQTFKTGFSFKNYGNTRGSIAAKNIGIYFKNFHKNDIAPLGLYSKYELLFLSYNVSYSAERVFKNLHESEQYPSYTNLGPYTALMFAYSIGKQAVYFDRLILNGSFQSAFSPKMFGKFFAQGIGDNPSEKKYIEQITQSRLFGAYFINFNLGIGYLIF
ncbi:MAG: hypothetical protein H0V01_08740 [Bacteroidetes bacterium]|nr:hypothetical protein [Bacteroidota bacterium]HET6244576.1 hypothetical protein [Bacteroidia bacterium]